jgi:glucose-1-phosphate thymidylyltransferase
MENLERIGLIPAAGRGLRMGLPFPKELFPILEEGFYQPVAHFTVDRIIKADVSHIVFVINETKQQLIKYFGNGENYNCNISYVVQDMKKSFQDESTSPGLAHALDAAYHLTKHKSVCFGMADTIMHPAMTFQAGYQSVENDTDVILCLFKTCQPEKFGMGRFDDLSGEVFTIIDKPSLTDLKWMWGSIIWGPKFTDLLHHQVDKQNNADFASILNKAISSGLNVKAVKFEDGQFIDIGTYDDALNYYHGNASKK